MKGILKSAKLFEHDFS